MEKSRKPRYSGASGLLQETIAETTITEKTAYRLFIRPQDNSFHRQQTDINFAISFLNRINHLMFILENEVLKFRLLQKGQNFKASYIKFLVLITYGMEIRLSGQSTHRIISDNRKPEK